MQLIGSIWNISEYAPIRTITIGIGKLIQADEEIEQVSLLDDEETEKRKKQDRIESTIDALRRKTGNKAVTLGFGKNEDIGIK